jgi:two-component system, chemotaxis family, sensor kinase CheA
MAQDPYKYFRLEARELLDQFGTGLLELEKNGGGAAAVQRLLRYAHTLKGAARVVKQPEIADRAHAIEEALSPYRETPDSVPHASIDVILKHLDDLGGRIGGLAPMERTEVAVQRNAAVDDGPRSVRADMADMDALLDGVSETHALLTGLRTAARAVEQAEHRADLLLAQLAPHGNPDRAYAMAQELCRSLGGLERNLGSSIDQMDRELRQLRDGAEQLRLVSAGVLLAALERTARDAAQAMGKQVMFAGTGGELRLDAQVLATVQSALVQIVRNAVAHGIESESDRRAAGKPASGRVTVAIARRGGRIRFECRDDGRGVDLEAVRRVALQRGLLGAAAQRSNAEDLVRLLLQGGISTAAAVTEVSGRGIGLDVVRAAVAQLGGDVTVGTEPGKGTNFLLTVPPSLAAMTALVVEAAGFTVTIPLDAVRSTKRITAAEIAGGSIAFEKSAIPFMPLQKAIDGTRASPNRNWTAVIVAGAGGLTAVGVDRMLGTATIVVRPLPDHAAASAILAGVSLDAEGNPQLVLDPDGLVAEAQRGDIAEIEPVPAARPVLVIDDSLTTRMLEQSILESAGYEVDVALSAEEGLESARRKRYALFLVDVEMPGMDGFSFVERIRADPALHEIPAILVTSRAAPEDRQRGRDVGAQGYVIKSEFDQAALLGMIRPLAR